MSRILFLLISLMGCSGTWSDKQIQPIPQINRIISDDYLRSHYLWMGMTSSADIENLYGITVDRIEFEVAIDQQSRINYIQTDSKYFVTTEGVSIKSLFQQVQKINIKIVHYPGWCSYVPLPSGWNAVFIIGDNLTEPRPNDTTKVIFFFRKS